MKTAAVSVGAEIKTSYHDHNNETSSEDSIRKEEEDNEELSFT